jgi:hypothetical protein
MANPEIQFRGMKIPESLFRGTEDPESQFRGMKIPESPVRGTGDSENPLRGKQIRCPEKCLFLRQSPQTLLYIGRIPLPIH